MEMERVKERERERKRGLPGGRRVINQYRGSIKAPALMLSRIAPQKIVRGYHYRAIHGFPWRFGRAIFLRDANGNDPIGRVSSMFPALGIRRFSEMRNIVRVSLGISSPSRFKRQADDLAKSTSFTLENRIRMRFPSSLSPRDVFRTLPASPPPPLPRTPRCFASLERALRATRRPTTRCITAMHGRSRTADERALCRSCSLNKRVVTLRHASAPSRRR